MKQYAVLLILTGIAHDAQVLWHKSDTPYGFCFFTFETDRFGGSFLQVTVDNDGNIKNTTDQRQMTIADIKNAVPKLRDELLKHRDLAALADFINSQNED